MKRVLRLSFKFIGLTMLLFATSHVARAQMPSTCVVGTNIYYVSSSVGSDSNTQAQAKNKTTPWKHAPYQVSFTGNYSHTPGDCFVFRGGDTWTSSDYFTIPNGGSSSSLMDYYGVDQTWHSGSSWARPVLNIAGVIISTGKIFGLHAGYIQIDNWEVIGAACNTSTDVQVFGEDAEPYIYITNNYVHDFQTVSTGCGTGGELEVFATGGAPTCNGIFDHNVVDGSDNGGNGYVDVITVADSDCSAVTHNVVHDVCSAFSSYNHVEAFNTIYNIGNWSTANYNCSASQGGTDGHHPDGFQTATGSDIHDNVAWHVVGELVAICPGQNETGVPWPVSHIYNNVFFANGPATIEIGTGGCGSSSDEADIYNNTFECDSGVPAGPTANNGCLTMYINVGTVVWENNDEITSTGAFHGCISNPPISCGTLGAASFTYSAASEVYQTMSAATAQGYCTAATTSSCTDNYAYAPTSSSSPTVTNSSAVNLSSLCTPTVLLCMDTEYGVTQGPGNVATAGRTQNARTSWETGGYMLGSGSSGLPSPPSDLVAAVE